MKYVRQFSFWTWLTIVISYFVEGGLVRGIEAVVPLVGLPVAWLTFIFGGFALGLAFGRLEKAYIDPFHRLCAYLFRQKRRIKLWRCGFNISWGIFASALLGGAMGVSPALRVEGYPHRYRWLLIEALIFACFWVPFFTIVPL